MMDQHKLYLRIHTFIVKPLCLNAKIEKLPTTKQINMYEKIQH